MKKTEGLDDEIKLYDRPPCPRMKNRQIRKK
jgi:hypothetical protein